MHDATANSPEVWTLRAYELLASANLCHRRAERIANKRVRQRRHFPDGSPWVYLMLYAFAIEAILKALTIAKGSRAAANGTLARDFRTHNLLHLWSRAGLPLTADEAFLLDFLRAYIEIGRYPRAVSRRSAGRKIAGR
jgi:hypothetical protein